MSFFSSIWVNCTRKRHMCWWCGKSIEKGSAAHYTAGMGPDGDFGYGYDHPECRAAIDATPYNELLEGWLPGDHSRGRRDDLNAPPEFSVDYRGRTEKNHLQTNPKS